MCGRDVWVGRILAACAAAFVLVLVLLGIALSADAPRVAALSVGGERVDLVGIAWTKASREAGVRALPIRPGQGLLFSWPEEGSVRPSFWMRDVDYPLDVVWIGEDGRVIGVQAMPTCAVECRTYEPPVPVRYALEVRRGELPGVRAGTVVASIREGG